LPRRISITADIYLPTSRSRFTLNRNRVSN
jgi:hypothetical protein